MSVEQLYEAAIANLPREDQVRLASYILWKCSKMSPAEYRDEWSDEDVRDFTAFSVALFEVREAAEARP